MITLLLALVIPISGAAAGPTKPVTNEKVDWSDDNVVRDMILKESVQHFPGVCGCPFHFRGDGVQCGVKSAYDQTNGRTPLCYRTDVTLEMVEQFRAERKAKVE